MTGPSSSFDTRAVAGAAWSGRRVAMLSIIGTWCLYLGLVTVRVAVISPPSVGPVVLRQLLIAMAGFLLMWALYHLLSCLGRASVALRIAGAMLLALPASVALTLIDYEVLYVLSPVHGWSGSAGPANSLHIVVARMITEMYFVVAAWATLYTAVSSAIESQEAQCRASLAQAQMRNAQLRALRYQLNPHFFFNALNSISALVLRGDANGAERMIQALAQFLRSTLEEDAIEDATLAAELELQRLYLEIERVRFGDRIRVRMAVPEELLSARLPPLLLQPLVENVVRHAVASAEAPVTMTIEAHVNDDDLHLVVEDDGQRQDKGDKGTRVGIGLANAASRLAARYGASARCSHGPAPSGGFRVEMVLPLDVRSAPRAPRGPSFADAV